MTERDRLLNIFRHKPVDRVPVYYFGVWSETRQRWIREGFTDAPGPEKNHLTMQVPGMGPNWEDDIWHTHGLADYAPIGDYEHQVISESGDRRIYQNSLGAIIQENTGACSVPHTIKHALKPDRASWTAFKSYLNPKTPSRYPSDLAERCAAFNRMDKARFFMGGSLYGHLRDWMGAEQISYLMYDDPSLLKEMVAYMADYYMCIYEPVLRRVKFDICYIFEDCCGSCGPLLSPVVFNTVFAEHYRRLFTFYKDKGVEFILLDSDGYVEPLIPCWQSAGVDILFPVEVGKWKADPAALRKRYGQSLMMFGGIDKHMIPVGGKPLREHLILRKPVVEAGGYLPIPDHRIPPDCSYKQFLDYIKVFNEIMNGQQFYEQG